MRACMRACARARDSACVRVCATVPACMRQCLRACDSACVRARARVPVLKSMCVHGSLACMGGACEASGRLVLLILVFCLPAACIDRRAALQDPPPHESSADYSDGDIALRSRVRGTEAGMNESTDATQNAVKRITVASSPTSEHLAASHLFATGFFLAILALLALCATLVSYTSLAPTDGSYMACATDIEKQPMASTNSRPLRNMPAVSLSAGYLLCWVFPFWTTVQIWYWGVAQAHTCGGTELEKLHAAGILNAVSWTRPVSWMTVISSMTVILTSAMVVKVGLWCEGPGKLTPSSGRSALIDNAKIGAIVMVIYGHILFWNSIGVYHDAAKIHGQARPQKKTIRAMTTKTAKEWRRYQLSQLCLQLLRLP